MPDAAPNRYARRLSMGSYNRDDATENPFSADDPDRRAIWQLLMEHDFEAFVQQDWTIVKDDFANEGFLGIDAGLSIEPDTWKLKYPSVDSYRDEWLRQA